MAPIALLSVSNKQGLLPLAKALINEHGFQLISSGGTAKSIESEGLPVTRVADFTGAPEILGGRVKTLHPRIHGGILAQRGNSDHQADLAKQKIPPIDLVVVNLYPFQETIADPNVAWDAAIEKIDIGGPAMIRAAAKNHDHVAILTRPDQYDEFLNALKRNSNGVISKEIRRKLALEAFEHTASYDIAISRWLQEQGDGISSHWLKTFPLQQNLRYGENPHQTAAWFGTKATGWGNATQLQGKALSTNNLLDLEAALSTVREFGYETLENKVLPKPTAVIIKHCNPCGVATDKLLSQALNKALNADPISAFGGIVALNNHVDADTANQLNSLFLECIVAPGYDKEALEILASKRNLRLLKLTKSSIEKAGGEQFRSILGGVLVQDQDNHEINLNEWQIVTKNIPSTQEQEDLIFAWRVSRHVRSNAIVIASSGQSLGIGAGQMNRIGSAKLALEAAGEKAKGAVLASDGFFPFDDTVRLAAQHGIKAIIQPGGSIKDADSISACDDLNIAMVLTGIRHFLH